jgi:hypothetical protein
VFRIHLPAFEGVFCGVTWQTNVQQAFDSYSSRDKFGLWGKIEKESDRIGDTNSSNFQDETNSVNFNCGIISNKRLRYISYDHNVNDPKASTFGMLLPLNQNKTIASSSNFQDETNSVNFDGGIISNKRLRYLTIRT